MNIFSSNAGRVNKVSRRHKKSFMTGVFLGSFGLGNRKRSTKNYRRSIDARIGF